MANTRAQKTAQNLSTLTTAGDIAYASAAGTPARLAAGTSGYVLTSGGASTAPSWAASASGFTFIKRASFSAVANTSTTFNSIASAAYKTYMILFEGMFASTADDLELQLSYGATTQAGGYYGSYTPSSSSTGAVSSVGYRAAAQMALAGRLGDATTPGSGFFYANPLGVSGLPSIVGQYIEGVAEAANTFGGFATTTRTYDGFVVKSTSANITGTITVYGLATA